MKRLIIAGLFMAGLVGMSGIVACSNSSVTPVLSTPAGQIFCSIQLNGGGNIAVALFDATAAAGIGGAAPLLAVGATATQAYLNAQCNAAAKAVPNATGSVGAIPAPAMPVQPVTITPVPVTPPA